MHDSKRKTLISEPAAMQTAKTCRHSQISEAKSGRALPKFSASRIGPSSCWEEEGEREDISTTNAIHRAGSEDTAQWNREKLENRMRRGSNMWL
jgi:hypothetical protein